MEDVKANQAQYGIVDQLSIPTHKLQLFFDSREEEEGEAADGQGTTNGGSRGRDGEAVGSSY